MPASILVVYATKYGSTQQVAESIVETLRKEGREVNLRPAREVRSLEGVQAVILGAPLYMFRWHKDAKQFLARHRKTLENMPVAIFALGPWNNKEEELQSARDQLNKELAKYPWLTPVNIMVFVGRFDPSLLSFPFNLVPALKQMPAQDDRDWDSIQAWAESLGTSLVSLPVPG
jgi:menaquinone-dependent protoporphyrinogen oxidase